MLPFLLSIFFFRHWLPRRLATSSTSNASLVVFGWCSLLSIRPMKMHLAAWFPKFSLLRGVLTINLHSPKSLCFNDCLDLTRAPIHNTSNTAANFSTEWINFSKSRARHTFAPSGDTHIYFSFCLYLLFLLFTFTPTVSTHHLRWIPHD